MPLKQDQSESDERIARDAEVPEFARTTPLTGLSLLSTAIITATDTVLSAFGKLQAQLSARVFGTEYQSVFNATSISNNSSNNTYTLHTTLITTALPAGDYLVKAIYDLGVAANDGETDVTLFNGATVLKSHHPVLSSNQGSEQQQLEYEWKGVTAGAKTITLQFRRGANRILINDISTVSQVTLMLFRVK